MDDAAYNGVLRNCEEKFSSFINESAYGYVEFDLEGNFTFANKSVILLTGYTLEDAMNFKDVIIEEDLQRAMNDLALVLEEPNAGPREYRFKRKDGNIIDIEVNTLSIREFGKITGFQSTVLDISKRKEAERKIIESELKYRRLFEHLKEGIIVSGPDGTIKDANPAAAEMLGYNDSELIGQPAETIYADMHHREKIFKLLNEYNYIKDYEMPLKRKDGAIMYANGSATLHRDVNGHFLKVEGIFFDITEKKEIEKKLVESEKSYRTLVESTKDMIFRGELDGKIIFMNKAVETILGYSKDELKNMNCFKGVHPDDLKRVHKTFSTLIEGKGIENVELRYRIKDGTYIDILVNAQPVYEADMRVIGFSGIARDITALKKANRELKRSQSIVEAYMEATTDAAVMIDLNGTIVDLNDEFTRRFGKDKKQLHGENIFGLFPDDVAIRRREMGKQVIQSGKPLHVQDERDGMWNKASIHPLFNENGKISHLVIFTHEITEFKRMERELTESRNELEKKIFKRTAELEEVNTALRVLVKSRNADAREMEDRIVFNVNELILPNLEELRNTEINKSQRYLIDIMGKNLEEITSQFIHGIEGRYLKLTPAEMKVANLVKQGKTNKQIAELYKLSPRTVESHRENIRKKTGIKNKKVNLRSYLVSNE